MEVEDWLEADFPPPLDPQLVAGWQEVVAADVPGPGTRLAPGTQPDSSDKHENY